MKVHISVKNKPLEGYLNLDYNSIDQLVDKVDDAEALEILVEDMINYIPLNEMAQFLKILVSKLRHSGILKITGTDAYEIARSYVNGIISIKDLNDLLYSGNDVTKTCAVTLHDLAGSFQEKSEFRILKKRLHNCNFCLEVQRL